MKVKDALSAVALKTTYVVIPLLLFLSNCKAAWYHELVTS